MLKNLNSTSKVAFFSSTTTSSPASFSHDKVATDERYKTTTDVPESLLQSQREQEGERGEFSIRGEFRQGRAAYLDMSATTPLDPRVFDKMAPFMVRSYSVLYTMNY